MQEQLSIVSLAIGAVLAAFGAVIQAALQHFFWKREHRSVVEREKERERERDEKENKRERERVAERFRELGGLVIEISRVGLSGPQIDQTELTTTTLIENYRFRRELLVAIAAVRDVCPNKERLSTFQGLIMQRTNFSEEAADRLRTELHAIADEIEKQ
jgi:hypothetical protein